MQAMVIQGYTVTIYRHDNLICALMLQTLERCLICDHILYVLPKNVKRFRIYGI